MNAFYIHTSGYIGTVARHFARPRGVAGAISISTRRWASPALHRRIANRQRYETQAQCRQYACRHAAHIREVDQRCGCNGYHQLQWRWRGGRIRSSTMAHSTRWQVADFQLSKWNTTPSSRKRHSIKYVPQPGRISRESVDGDVAHWPHARYLQDPRALLAQPEGGRTAPGNALAFLASSNQQKKEIRAVVEM